MRRLCAFLSILVLVTAAACKKEEAPPPPPPQQPAVHIPTAEEIKAEIVKTLEPFHALSSPDKEPLPPAIHGQALGALRATIAKHQTSENGPSGISMSQRQIENMLSQAEKNELWAQVVAMCDALEIIAPDTTRTKRARQDAMVQLNRPKVTIRGFMEDHATGRTIVLMRIRIPATGEAFQGVQAEVGEEVLPKPYTLRLLSIIGENRGINMEYVATGDTFQIYTEHAQSMM